MKNKENMYKLTLISLAQLQ